MKPYLIALICIEIALLVSILVFPRQITATGQITANTGIITAYSSEESQTDSEPEIMASGKVVYKGAIACPRKYAFGQRVEIAGKTYTCEDRKNIRYESYPEEWFDIWFESKESALSFGIQEHEIIVLKKCLMRVVYYLCGLLIPYYPKH